MKAIPASLKTLKNEKLGFSMIGASLVVILFISAFLFNDQHDKQIEQIRSQGTSLVRLLADIPIDGLPPSAGRSGLLDVIWRTQDNPQLAYIALVGPSGAPLAQVARRGVLIPGQALPSEPSGWFGERKLTDEQGHTLVEYFGALLDDGELQGYLRVGYRQPEYGLDSNELPLFATLALAVFLLTPLFYFLIKREFRPLAEINGQLKELMDPSRSPATQLHASGELREFMENFNDFVAAARQRIQTLELQHTDADMSKKVLGYQKARIESALQSLPDAVVIMDESGTITYANKRLNTLLGKDPAEVVGSPARDWCTNSEVSAYLGACHANSARTYRNDSVEFSPDNRPDKQVSVRAYPLFSPRQENVLLGTLFLFRDISDQVVAQRAHGEFVAHVAHELKTPLNVLHMYSETLQDDAGSTPSLTVEAANVIHEETERLSTLISNLLGMTKIEIGSVVLGRQRVKLQDLLKDVFTNISQGARHNDIRFELEVPPELSALSLDKDLIRIALNNLMTNAIKYNKAGGSVTVSAEEDDEAIVVRVSDTGIGISAHDQEHIFDKFYRSESKEVRMRSGHGLGLSLAREIIHLHHGELELQSRLGQGSEFIIRFNKDAGLLRQAV
jgi:PAS domain S-box-containing protein